jgi:hypothetical protein
MTRLWQLATDTLPLQDARNLEEDLGIEKGALKRKWAGQ